MFNPDFNPDFYPTPPEVDDWIRQHRRCPMPERGQGA